MDGSGWTLRAVCEWIAHDPFGKPKPTDVSEDSLDLTDERGVVVLRAPRNGYVSFRLLVQGRGEYRLRAAVAGSLEVDLYKAWYHRMVDGEGGSASLGRPASVSLREPPPPLRDGPTVKSSRACPTGYYPDALLLVQDDVAFHLPDPENRIEGQTVQEFWVDVFVPPDVEPGPAAGRIALKSGSQEVELPLEIEVLDLAISDEPCIIMDHNCYGYSWLRRMYPSVFAGSTGGGDDWPQVIELLHDYYRLVYEHRGLLHNLGFNHAGSFAPIYGPRTEGSGRAKSLVGWELHDRLLGPLLDGSVFAKAAPGSPAPRRSAAPVWSVYSPITPDWPASYLWWGEPGYEVEFRRGLKQFDQHYRKNGWTRTRIEFFFNHKKRYRWFEWDGDEPKFAKDDAYHMQMGRMWRAAIQGSPVKWVYRMDASWQMKNQFERLRGLVDFWVLGGFSRWYREEVRAVIEWGDAVWWYGGTPGVDAPSSNVLQSVYKTWVRGFHGYCAWLTTNPGTDPWFNCDGAATGMIYPGDRFGIAGPIASIRLKLERNGVQDIDLLNRSAEERRTLDAVREELGREIPIQLWEEPPLAARVLPPEDWDNRNLATDIEPGTIPLPRLDPLWWRTMRARALAEESRP